MCCTPHLVTSLSSSSVTSAPGLGSLSSLSMLMGMEMLGLPPPLSEEETASGRNYLTFNH